MASSFSTDVHMKKKSKSLVRRSSDHHNKRRKRSSELVKVVYISSPMMVKTSASKFRSLVQELTGRDSDISRFNIGGSGQGGDMGNINDEFFAGATNTLCNFSEEEVVPTRLASSDSLGAHSHSLLIDDTSPTSSETFLDDVFSSDMVERLEGMFSSSLLYNEFSSDQLI